jgi:hypothetical protein
MRPLLSGLWLTSLSLTFSFSLSLLLPGKAFAMDRALAVHSRIESALSRILHRSDYLVIVNRLDELEDGGANTATAGQVRRLPGLNVGVDTSGRVIRSDEAAGEYNGGVSISLVLDPEVREETYDLIQKSIPELAGGLRDTDEFRISRSVLRQAPPPNSQSPQVAVNNNMSDPSKGTDLLRQLAIGLAFLGLFVWILSRLLNRSSKDSGAGSASPRAQSGAEAMDPAAQDERKKSEKHLAELDPQLTGFYLIRAQASRQMDRIRTWSQGADPSTQRAVLLSLPGWMASSLEKTLREAIKDTESPRVDLATVYLEISVLEQNLKDPAERQRALLSWFPATYLRDVPSHQRDQLSRASRLVLWSLRPELGDFVKLENESYEEAIEEPSALAIQKCYAEMSSWNSKEVIGERSQARDAVEAMAVMINQLKEFGPIESRLSQAREKLSAEDFARLESKVVWSKTPLSFTVAQAKDWLRQVEPQDYLWWLHLVGQSPGWKLEEMLRPLRLSMFKNAESDPLYTNWSESQRKAAAERILTQLREIHLAKDSGNEMAA